MTPTPTRIRKMPTRLRMTSVKKSLSVLRNTPLHVTSDLFQEDVMADGGRPANRCGIPCVRELHLGAVRQHVRLVRLNPGRAPVQPGPVGNPLHAAVDSVSSRKLCGRPQAICGPRKESKLRVSLCRDRGELPRLSHLGKVGGIVLVDAVAENAGHGCHACLPFTARLAPDTQTSKGIVSVTVHAALRRCQPSLRVSDLLRNLNPTSAALFRRVTSAIPACLQAFLILQP